MRPSHFTFLSNRLSILYVAITALIMAYSIHISVIPILIMYALWLPFFVIKPKEVIYFSRDLIIPCAMAIYFLFTAFWSTAPTITLYAATQFISMVLCSLVVARIVTFEAFIKGICLGSCLVLIPLFKSGSYSIEGLFSSKNMVGLWSQVGITTATCLLLIREKEISNRFLFAVPTLLLSTICILLSKSAAAIISTSVCIGFIFLGALFARFDRGLKKIVLGMLIFGVISIATTITAFEINPQKDVLAFFDKDPTLTGRTDLWKTGMEVAQNSILLGHGYYAFWLPGNPVAEKLWEDFYISSKTGFHFHNLFVETLVDLGALGLLIILAALITLWIKALHTYMLPVRRPEELFLLGFAMMISIRAFVEIDILNPFGIGSFLFLVMLMFPSQPSINQKRDLHGEL